MQLAEKNQELIRCFYTAFANRDVETMLSYYHENVVYEDVGFGIQKEENAKAVWLYLMENSDKNAVITFSNIQADNLSGSVKWNANYKFNNRKIENHISATFHFRNGKIIYHKDDYSLWKWSQQAFGIVGYLIGWSLLFQWLIRWQMRRFLKNFIENLSDNSQT